MHLPDDRLAERPPTPVQSRRRALCVAVLACASGLPPAAASQAEAVPSPPHTIPAQQLLRWVLATGDHQGLPFVLIDKPVARIHAYSAQGRWLGSAPVLLGAARGDRSPADIGRRALSQIRPEERTTPAGRFLTEPGRNLRGDDIVWIDYDSAVSLHRVRSVHASERRQQRLASAGTGDKRISYGCINAPADFYDRVIGPLLGRGPGVAYVLPDTEPFAIFFEAANRYP